MTEIEKVKSEIKVLQSKLSFLEELERTKSRKEMDYKRVYGEYPNYNNPSQWEMDSWDGFFKGYDMGYSAAQEDYKVGKYQETPQTSEEVMEKLGFVKNSDGNWTAQPLVETAEEQTKDKVPLYKRFENEGAYGQLYYDNALKVVRGFLIDEGVIECEDEEYITITLQKSLLDVFND